MPLVQLVLALVTVAVAAWLINMYARVQGTMALYLNTVLMLLVVGMALWLINTYVPMAGSIKAILNIMVVTLTCMRVLQVVGLWGQIVRLWRNLINRHPPASRAE